MEAAVQEGVESEQMNRLESWLFGLKLVLGGIGFF